MCTENYPYILFFWHSYQKKTPLCGRCLPSLPVLVWLCSAAEQKSSKSSGTVHISRDRAACIPAFLQIRPGKADYSNLIPASPFQCGWRVREDIFRFVWLCYLPLPFQHLGGEGGQRGYMTLLSSSQLPGIAILLNVHKC